jgi:hypothetical protein
MLLDLLVIGSVVDFEWGADPKVGPRGHLGAGTTATCTNHHSLSDGLCVFGQSTAVEISDEVSELSPLQHITLHWSELGRPFRLVDFGFANASGPNVHVTVRRPERVWRRQRTSRMAQRASLHSLLYFEDPGRVAIQILPQASPQGVLDRFVAVLTSRTRPIKVAALVLEAEHAVLAAIDVDEEEPGFLD